MNLKEFCAGVSLMCAALSLQVVKGYAAPDPEVRSYKGTCEPSGAVSLTNEFFAVANDEDNTLRVYSRVLVGLPVSDLDLGSFLGLDVGSDDDDKADLEAAARIGDRIFWLGSHSRSRQGRVRKQRQQFFSTLIVEGTPQQPRMSIENGERSRSLLEAIAGVSLTSPEMSLSASIGGTARNQALAPEGMGLNIEGLSANADGSGLVLGLRNPLHDKRAILLELTNPIEVLRGDTMPHLNFLKSLDLGGRGIRSIEYSHRLASFIIVAGPPSDEQFTSTDGGPRFRIFGWSGTDSQDAKVIEEVDSIMRQLDAVDFHAEALIVLDETSELELLSDDGDFRGPAGTACKDAPTSERGFRSVRIPIP